MTQGTNKPEANGEISQHAEEINKEAEHLGNKEEKQQRGNEMNDWEDKRRKELFHGITSSLEEDQLTKTGQIKIVLRHGQWTLQSESNKEEETRKKKNNEGRRQRIKKRIQKYKEEKQKRQKKLKRKKREIEQKKRKHGTR